MTAWRSTAALMLLMVAIAAGVAFLARPRFHFADAGDAAATARGALLYAGNCADCHGAHLEGAADRQIVGTDGIVRPPPQNEIGHTWMHSDEELFGIVKHSMAEIAVPGYVSPMPAFEGRLGDEDILATLAFIKSQWPIGVRAYQALLNPDRAGMPAEAARGEWTLPADCGTKLTRAARKPKGSS